MRFKVVGVANVWSTTLWMGSYERCEQQAGLLRRAHSRLLQPALVGICVGEPNVEYLKRWTVDQWGYVAPHTTLYYGNLDTCLSQIWFQGDGDGEG